MQAGNFLQQVKQALLKFVKRFLIVSVLLGIAVLCFLYFGVYERGVMAGKVLRVTEKGLLFKTHEGKISLDTFGALKGASPIAETFDFSIASGDVDVLQQLQEVSLSGERVNLIFIKRYMRFPWRGDTRYFVTGVERLEK